VAVATAVTASLAVPAVPAGAGLAPNEWVRQFGTDDYEDGNGVAADETGVYVVGRTDGTLPGQTRPVLGYSHAFVRKYDQAGSEAWTRQFGADWPRPVIGAVMATGVSAHDGRVYVAGFVGGYLPGQDHAGGADAFARAYDAAGSEQWTRQFGTDANDRALSVAADATGVYIAGYTNGQFPGQAKAGGPDDLDAFLRRYTLDGDLLWTRQFGTAEEDRAHGVAVDGTGVVVTGFTRGALPGQTSAGLQDVFVRRYDLNGNPLWTHQFGTSGEDPYTGSPTEENDVAWAVAADASGISVAGEIGGTLPGENPSLNGSAFVRRYRPDGTVVWTRPFGISSSTGRNTSIAIEGSGVFVAGGVWEDTLGQEPAGRSDVFVRRYDLDGNVEWTRQIGSEQNDDGHSVAVAGDDVYVGGRSFGALPGQTALGDWDAFVWRLPSVREFCGGRLATVVGTPGDDGGLSGTSGDDVIAGLGGDDVIRGFGGNDVICGGDGNDLLLGGPGDDTLDGGAGNDKLRGASGDDTLRGGAGSDRLLPETGMDTVDGGPGSDIVDYLAADGPITAELRAGGRVTYTPAGSGDSWIARLANVEKVDGTAYDDHLYGNGKRNVLRGKQGDDYLVGMGGDDDLIGGTGNDRLWGDQSGNTPGAADGADLVKGQAGDDFLYGEAGNDRIVGGNGADSLFGGTGDDTLIGGLKHRVPLVINTLDGGDGTDTCRWPIDILTDCD
jgi:Ca2+-binding RTX toxin-like protein